MHTYTYTLGADLGEAPRVWTLPPLAHHVGVLTFGLKLDPPPLAYRPKLEHPPFKKSCIRRNSDEKSMKMESSKPTV